MDEIETTETTEDAPKTLREEMLELAAREHVRSMNPGANVGGTQWEHEVQDTIQKLSQYRAFDFMLTKYMEMHYRLDELTKRYDNREAQHRKRNGELSNQIETIWRACVKACIDNDGCQNGKREFLEEVECPEELWPTVTIRMSRVIEMPYLGDGRPADADIANYIDECDSGAPLSQEFDYEVIEE